MLFCFAGRSGFMRGGLKIEDFAMRGGLKSLRVKAAPAPQPPRPTPLPSLPTIQHYGCMVELFGKAGLLGEAYEVVNTMSPEPIIVIWGSFLSSCKLHKQFEMAERVIEMVMNVVRPENDGWVYTLISDLYVLGDKWAEPERVRQLMLHQHVRKARGCSFIRNNTT